MSTGQGGSLGDALKDLFTEAGGSAAKASYRAVGWQAQVRKLSELGQRGSDAADAVGLDVTERTLKGWLAGNEPSKSNQQKISEAYQSVRRGQFPQHLKTAVIKISGEVAITNRKGISDVRDRGRGGQAPLLISAKHGDWSAIEEAWEAGELDAAKLEDLFTWDVVMNDPALDGISGTISFPGSSYSVSA